MQQPTPPCQAYKCPAHEHTLEVTYSPTLGIVSRGSSRACTTIILPDGKQVCTPHVFQSRMLFSTPVPSINSPRPCNEHH